MHKNQKKGTLNYFHRINSICKLIIREHYFDIVDIPDNVSWNLETNIKNKVEGFPFPVEIN